jgi:phytanoyl-CoA hydroxylase
MRLTPAQIESFRRDGVLIAPGILRDEDFAPVEAALTRHIDRRARELKAAGEISDLAESAPFDERIGQLYAQCTDIVGGLDIMELRAPEVFAFLGNARLLDAVECLVGPEITCNPIQHMRPKVASNLGAGGYAMVGWHQDLAVTWEEADASEIVTCWIPMVDATRATGCMEVIPGAHLLGLCEHNTKGSIKPECMPSLPAVAAECPRGGVIFMHRLLPHRGLPNVSNKVRWTLDLRYQKTGEPTGRPFYPDFPVRSAADPASVLTDHSEWVRRWERALVEGKNQIWHRAKKRAAEEAAVAEQGAYTG